MTSRQSATLWWFAAAVALPLIVWVIQATLWTQIEPFAWFLFCPVIFLAPWIAGPGGAVLATVALGFIALINLNIAGINIGMRHAAIGGSLGLAAGFVVLAGCALALVVALAGSLRAPTAR